MPMPSRPPYDLVMPVGPNSTGIGRIAVSSLLRFLKPDRIFLVAGTETLEAISRWKLSQLILLDEDTIVPGVKLQFLRDMLAAAGRDPNRAGWYIQQFVKMGMAHRDDVHEHYLVWDADTVLLRPLELYTDSGQVLIPSWGIPMLEYYRAMAERLLGQPVDSGVSCIREQMMFRKSWMLELLERIEAVGTAGESWAIRIMRDSHKRSDPENWARYQVRGFLKDYNGIWDFGFSEFELYAVFLRLYHPEEVLFREVRAERHGSRLFGSRPNRFDLEYLARKFDYASFEGWSSMDRRHILVNKWQAFRHGIKRRIGLR